MKTNRFTSPALAAAGCLASGIIAGQCLPIHETCLFAAFTLITLASTIGFFLNKQTDACLIVGLFILGMLIYQQAVYLPPNHVHYLTRYERPLCIEGILTEQPIQQKSSIRFPIKAISCVIGDTLFSVQGKIQVAVYDSLIHPPRYGDRLRLTGQIKKPGTRRNPGGFDYRAWLHLQGIEAVMQCTNGQSLQYQSSGSGWAVMHNVILPVRNWIRQHLQNQYQGQEKQLLTALILGDRSDMAGEIRENYAKAGIIHTLAVSGLHVGFITLIFLTLFSLIRLPQSFRLLATLFILLLYMAMTQFKPPVIRATLMAIVYLSGLLLRRKPHIGNTLGISALIILIIDPVKLFDAGFQLSFSAMASIIYLYPQLESLPVITQIRNRFHAKAWRYVFSSLILSTAAQLGTLPVIALYFNRLPILSPVINLAAIPLTGLTVCLSFTGLFVSCFSDWTAQSFIVLNTCCVQIMLKLAEIMANLPFAQLHIIRPSAIQILIYGTACLLLTQLRYHHKNRLLILLFASLNIYIYQQILLHRHPFIEWVQLDVGQGDAAVLHLPRGKIMIIDGGNKTPRFDAGQHVLAPYLRSKGIQTIDALLISHPHHDHWGGFSYLLKHFKIKQIISAGTPFPSTMYQQFLHDIDRRCIPHRIMTAPDSLIIDKNLQFNLLWPDSAQKQKVCQRRFNVNNQSLVFQLSYGTVSLLFTGDTEKPAERRYSPFIQHQPLQLLKVSHHGSPTSTCYDMLQAYSPDFSIISVGKNRFGHPDSSVIRRLSIKDKQMKRTDVSGAVLTRIHADTFMVKPFIY